MTRLATLVLAPSGVAVPGSPTPETRLLGLPLVRRAALAARRAGFDRVFVLGAAPGPALDGTGALALPRHGAEAVLPPGRIVLLPDRVVASPDWLRLVRETPVEAERCCRFGDGVIVETADPAPFAAALAVSSSLEDAASRCAAALRPGPDAAVAPPFVMTRASDASAAEKLLLKGLVKKQDSVLTRLISRKISLAVTRRLAGTPVTPNAMTFFCLALGLAAAWCFGSATAPGQLMGGVLFLLHSILDGCDGELARLKFRESRFGGALDFWADNVVHVAVFMAFGYSWSAAIDDDWPMALGVVAAAGTVLSAAFVYLHAMRPRKDAGPLLTTVSPARRTRLTELLDEASRRDFIYLVMVLACFGKGYWFLGAAAIGTPAFFATVAVLAFGQRRQAVPAATPAFR